MEKQEIIKLKGNGERTFLSEKRFANHISEKVLVSEIYKELLQHTRKKKRDRERNNPILKWAKYLHTHPSKDIPVASKHIKRFSTLLTSKEMQITATVGYTMHSLGWLK